MATVMGTRAAMYSRRWRVKKKGVAALIGLSDGVRALVSATLLKVTFNRVGKGLNQNGKICLFFLSSSSPPPPPPPPPLPPVLQDNEGPDTHVYNSRAVTGITEPRVSPLQQGTYSQLQTDSHTHNRLSVGR